MVQLPQLALPQLPLVANPFLALTPASLANLHKTKSHIEVEVGNYIQACTHVPLHSAVIHSLNKSTQDSRSTVVSHLLKCLSESLTEHCPFSINKYGNIQIQKFSCSHRHWSADEILIKPLNFTHGKIHRYGLSVCYFSLPCTDQLP